MIQNHTFPDKKGGGFNVKSQIVIVCDLNGVSESAVNGV